MIGNQDQTRLHDRRLALIRPVVFALGVALTLLAILSIYLTVREVLRQPEAVLPDVNLWTPALVQSALEGLRLPPGSFGLYALGLSILFALVFLVSGWLILWRKSRDGYGLFLGLVLLGWLHGFGIAAEMPPPPAWILEIQSYLSWFLWPGFFLQLYYFPNGQITPRWARWFAVMLWGLTLFGLSLKILDIELPNYLFILPLIIAALLVGGYSQVYRYRHAGPAERQQVKWVILALLVFAGLFIGTSLLINLTGIGNPQAVGPSQALGFHLIFSTFYLLSFMGLPISIVFAILRYRLWDIDVIIRKTLVWGALTALLGLVFFGGVTLLQSIFAAISNQQSAISIVISTLAIAALFNPLRRRVQEFVDRRFYRSKYDAEQALASFSALARQEVDLEEISARLLAVVEETVQPEHASLWLRPTVDGRQKMPAGGGQG